jgi:hypothetical protein
VNIVRWNTEAWNQCMSDFGARGIPYVRVYGTDGNLLHAEAEGNYERIEAAVRKQAE